MLTRCKTDMMNKTVRRFRESVDSRPPYIRKSIVTVEPVTGVYNVGKKISQDFINHAVEQ